MKKTSQRENLRRDLCRTKLQNNKNNTESLSERLGRVGVIKVIRSIDVAGGWLLASLGLSQWVQWNIEIERFHMFRLWPLRTIKHGEDSEETTNERPSNTSRVYWSQWYLTALRGPVSRTGTFPVKNQRDWLAQCRRGFESDEALLQWYGRGPDLYH